MDQCRVAPGVLSGIIGRRMLEQEKISDGRLWASWPVNQASTRRHLFVGTVERLSGPAAGIVEFAATRSPPQAGRKNSSARRLPLLRLTTYPTAAAAALVFRGARDIRASAAACRRSVRCTFALPMGSASTAPTLRRIRELRRLPVGFVVAPAAHLSRRSPTSAPIAASPLPPHTQERNTWGSGSGVRPS